MVRLVNDKGELFSVDVDVEQTSMLLTEEDTEATEVVEPTKERPVGIVEDTDATAACNCCARKSYGLCKLVTVAIISLTS